MVVDDKTQEDFRRHRWADASGRVLWNAGTMMAPTKVPGLNKLGKVGKAGRLGKAGRSGRVHVGGPREYRAAEKELDELRHHGGGSLDMLYRRGEVLRKFDALDPAERTRLLNSMSSEELRTFYEKGPDFGRNVRSDLLQAASPQAVMRLAPPEPRFTRSGGWHQFAGELWHPAPSPRDVVQGAVGDCFCVAASQSMATTPSGRRVLQEMITKNRNGTYTVEFGDGKRSPSRIGSRPGARRSVVRRAGRRSWRRPWPSGPADTTC